MYPMHPHISRALNQSRIHDLHDLSRPRRRRPSPARQATGWFLVRMGLRLALPAPRLMPAAR